MSSSDQILNRLAVAAEHFEFPVLDNAHWDLVAGRMRGFRRGAEWGLCFELFVFHRQASEFVVQIYGYGSLLREQPGLLDSIAVLEELPEDPLWNAEGYWVQSNVTRIKLYGQPILAVLKPSLETIGSSDVVVLADGDASDEGAFARALVRELGTRRILPYDLVYGAWPQLVDVPEVLRFANWDHPDIAAGEAPSASTAIRVAAAVLSGEEPACTHYHVNDNVFWTHWLLDEGAES